MASGRRALWLLGTPGVLAVVCALQPALAAHQALLPLPPWAMLLLAGAQSAALLALAVALGVLLAPRVGLAAPALSAWLARQPPWPALRPQLAPAVCGGLAAAAWLWSLALLAPSAPGDAMPPSVQLLYRVITEELLLRWGLLTLLLWSGWRLLQGGRGAPGKALLIAAAALSALPSVLGQTTAQTMLGSAIVAALTGALYLRHGLEAALLAHLLAQALAPPWA